MIFWWATLAGSTVGFTLGSALLKQFADTGAAAPLVLSFAVLGVSNLLFVHVIRTGLGTGIIASSMSQIILVAALGVLVFGERLSAMQVIGVALAATSIALLTGFGPNASDG